MKQQEAIGVMQNLKVMMNSPEIKKACDFAVEALEKQIREEKRDLVEVVHCRDCEKKISTVNVCGNVHCGLFRFWINADAFCSYGKK